MDTLSVPLDAIQNALDAMAWTFLPYLDDSSQIGDYPWIVELILSYNSIVSLLPEPARSQYVSVKI